MRLTGLNIHPVKSMAIRPVAAADVLLGGLATDRSWGVVDADGIMVTARDVHSLFAITPDTPATDPSIGAALRLRAADLPDLILDQPSGDGVRSKVFSHELQGIPIGPEADAWLQEALGRDDLRLVWCDDPTRRTLNPAHSRPEDHWSAVTIGEVRFRVAKPTDRCVMTTIEPETLETSKEPIRTLARHRLFDHKTMFAIHLIPESTGRIGVGDEVIART